MFLNRKLLFFTVFLAAAITPALALHWLISPVTETFLVLGAKIFYALFVPGLTLGAEDHALLLRSRSPAFEAVVNLRDLTVNQPILWALLLVTPGMHLYNRIKALLSGTALLMLTHLAFLVCKIEIILIGAGHAAAGYSLLWSNADNLFEISGKGFFPVVIWLALALPYLLGKIDRRDRVPVKKIGRNDPCPCGSGKKFKKCCMP